MTSDAPDIHALSGAYSLDALDASEAAAFERHLESCAPCRDEVRSFRDAVGALADDAVSAPPERLRASVLAGIADVRPLPPVVEDPAVDEHATDALAVRRLARARRTSRLLRVAAAVLAVLAAGALWRSVALGREVSGMTAAAADVAAVLTAPDASTVTASVSTGGRAALVVSRQRGQAVLVTDGMAPAPAGKTYQVWYVAASGAATPAGFVPAGEHGAVVLEGSPASAAAVGVTVEPEGGSPQPTSTPVLVVKV